MSAVRKLMMWKGKQIRSCGKVLVCGLLVITICFLWIINNNSPGPLKEEESDISALLLNISNEINQIANIYFETNRQTSNVEKIEEIKKAEIIKDLINAERVKFINRTSEAETSVSMGVEKSHNFTAFKFQMGLIHKFYCPASRVEQDEWKGHFLKFNSTDVHKMNFIPTVFEESPIGIAPTIPIKFIIEEAGYCTNRSLLTTVALVPSAIMNIERRHTTRRTWGSASEELGVIFFVGVSKNQTENEIILKESKVYHDIVQGEYTDLYQFLVYKNLNAFHWLIKHCNSVKWVVHADDDSLLNTKKFVQFVNTYNYSHSVEYIFCSLQCDSNTLRSGCKCAVREEMYPYKNYPIYCSGYLWFTSMENIKSLLDAALSVKFLWIDDVYVTGLLAERANISRYGIDLRGVVNSKEVENIFGWMMSGIDRNEHWKKVEDYYLNS